ncbi:MarR family transcriptional regulator [Intrasporangium flavum]|uniref:MarR family transcriptional regulator n=1 Tax=Intrasporangium flavum TaxID=1428657 RepID=UPI00096E0911|nr:MarR family transcriptional regulator [Intrasporangium flavum]
MSPSRQPARDDLVEALGSAMQQYQRSVQAFDDAVGRLLDLGPSDLRCLDWLVDGPKTAGQLSTATGLRPAATTALVDRLARRGLVRRRRSETDRRAVLVEMTEHGNALTWQAYGPLVAAGRPMLDELSPEQLAFMTDYLHRITALTDDQREQLGRRD